MSDQTQVAAVNKLVTDGVIDRAQADAVLAALQPARSSKPTAWLAEAAGYIGGGLMLGGAMLVLGQSWETMTRTGHYVFLLAIATALVIVAALTAGGPLSLVRLSRAPSGPRRRVASVLLTLAPIPVAWAIGILVEGRHAPTAGTLGGLALSLLVLIFMGTMLSVVAVFGFSIAALMASVYDAWPDIHGYQGATLIVVLGLAWMLVGVIGLVKPRPLVLGLGSALGIVGGLMASSGGGPGWLPYTLIFAVALVSLMLYALVHDLVLIVAAVIGVTISVVEAVQDWTDGRVSGQVIVLLTGVVLALASAVGFKIAQKRDGIAGK